MARASSESESVTRPASNGAARHTDRNGDTRWLTRVLQPVGFWSAVLLPFFAIGLLAVRPDGWVPMVAAAFLVNVGALVAGHCHGVDC